MRALGFGTINRSAGHYGLSLILGGAEISLWDLTSAYMKMAAKLNGRQTIRTPHYDPGGGTEVDARGYSPLAGRDMADGQFDKPRGPS